MILRESSRGEELTRYAKKMEKYCGCSACLKNEMIQNPYDIYQKQFLIEDISLNFEYQV